MNRKEKKYLDYIRSQYPDIEINHAAFDFKNGTHNDIVIVDENTVFKFSRYDWSVFYLANEVRAINLVKNYVDITLPDIISLEPGAAKCNFIKGKPLHRNQLLLQKSLEQDLLAKSLGTFLKQLHAIPLEDVKANKIENSFAADAAEYWDDKYKELQSKLFPYCDNYTKEYIRQLFQPVLEQKGFFSYTPSMIHANLNPRHIICDPESYKINGITGFGSSGIGDPAFDTGMLLASLGESFVSRVSEYDESIPEQIDRARFYARLQRLDEAKELADRIAARDFTNFKMNLFESDIMPIGKH